MISENNSILTNKISEINKILDLKGADMFEVIGSVRDLFSSSYNNEVVADSDRITELWNVLFKVFINDSSYDNKFDAIFAMSDISNYAQKHGVKLNTEALRKWRHVCDRDNISLEILECVDDMIIE
jgi:hypothetical protein